MLDHCAIDIYLKLIGNIIKIWIIAFFSLMLSIPPSSAGEMVILTCEEPPTNYEKNNNIVGISVDIVQAILDRLKQKKDLELLPWARAYKMGINTPNVVLFTGGRTQERIDLGFSFVGPVITRTHGLFSLEEKSISLTGLETIHDKHLTIGGMIGDWRTSYLVAQGVSVDTVPNHIMNLKKILHHRIDLFISSDIELPTLAQSIGISHGIFQMSYIIKKAPSFIMISKGTSAATIGAWQEAFEDLKTTDYVETISKKWSVILGYPITFDNRLGFNKK